MTIKITLLDSRDVLVNEIVYHDVWRYDHLSLVLGELTQQYPTAARITVDIQL